MRTIQVMVNGLPGRMARQTAETILEADGPVWLTPFCLTGPETKESSLNLGGNEIRLIPPERRKDLHLESPVPAAIDFTEPDAVAGNVEWYCERGVSFVLGTTGGDEEQVRSLVEQSDCLAVLAPNLAGPVLLVMDALEHLGTQYPKVFDGWSAEIEESHQSGKKDTSGTAKRMVGYLQRLGVDFSVEQIEKIRQPEEQRHQLNIPEEHLAGHAFHTYRLNSADRTVRLGLSHNVLGRSVYAQGALHAVRFVAERTEAGEKGRVYDMLDVLRAQGGNDR